MIKRISITIEENDYTAFKSLCEKNGFKISTRISLLVRHDLEDHKYKRIDNVF